MEDNNKQNNKQVNKQEEAPKPMTGATTAKSSSWKRLLAKKWVFPATYMAAAAIILSLMWVYQGAGDQEVSNQDLGLSTINQELGENGLGLDSDAMPVTVPAEIMQWPVANFNEIEVSMPYFDEDASNEAKQAATIQYQDTFIPNVGISLSRQDLETFDVLAALSGTVTRVEKHPLVGNQVEITHSEGLKTVYQSLSDVSVEEGQEIAQGDVIAHAGRNELQKDLGVHLHFEVYQDDQPVNPEEFIAESATNVE
jgi:stage II sporulation protein Q